MRGLSEVRFCSNCGATLEDDSKYCSNCGSEVYKSTSSTESSVNDMEQEPRFFYQAEESTNDENAHDSGNSEGLDDSIKRAATASAQKALDGAHDLVDKFNKKIEDSRTASNEKIEEEIKKQKQEIENQKKKMRLNSKSYMSGNELWSWLKQSSKRQHFYTEQISILSEDEYFEELKTKISDNLVPAVIEKKNFHWDRSGVHKEDYIVKPLTADVNPLSCLIQFIHIGKFTFVEEKTFITPPNLPDVPLKKKPIDENIIKISSSLMTYGIIAFIVGLILNAFVSTGSMIIMCGVVLFIAGILLLLKNKSILEYNKKCEEMEKAWEDAWINWQESIFIHSFQEDINGQVSRIYDSVFECVKQVNDGLFNAKEVVEVSESTSINDLESIIERRKQEYR